MTEEQTNLLNKIEEVLERLRPFLQREGGDVQLDHYDFDSNTCYVKMVGACNGCYMASSDVSDTIAVLLMDEIPEIKDVQLVQPEQESLEDLLKRLKEEEQANKELEEYNKTHKNDNSAN